MGRGRPHHGGVLLRVALGGRGVAVGVLHVVVILGGSPCPNTPCSCGTSTLQLGIGLVALGERVHKLVAAHVHRETWEERVTFQTHHP